MNNSNEPTLKVNMLLAELSILSNDYHTSSRDKDKMEEIVKELIKEGWYPSEPTPAMIECGYSVGTMVESWGVNWNVYGDPTICPNCKANLKNEKLGPPFKREIGMYDWELDMTVDFICPDCYKSLETGRQYDKEEFEKANNAPILEE